MHKGKWNSRFPFFFAATLYRADECLNMIGEGKHKNKNYNFAAIRKSRWIIHFRTVVRQIQCHRRR